VSARNWTLKHVRLHRLLADPQLIASALLFRIFIDKFNVFRNRTYDPGLAVAEKCLMGRQSTGETRLWRKVLIFIVEVRPRLETPPKES